MRRFITSRKALLTGAAVAAMAIAGGVSGVALASNPGPWPTPVVTGITTTTDSVSVTVAPESGATFRYLLVDQDLHLVTGAAGPGDAANKPGDGVTTSTTITWTGLSPGTAYEFELAAVYGGRADSHWTALHNVFTTAAQGAQGPAGKTGATGPQGPPGVVATTQQQLVTVTNGLNIKTGGPFSKNSTLVGTVKLPAGTYLINVNFEATPNATTGGVVFPQLMVYSTAFTGSNWNDDLFNVGSGNLEDPTATDLTNNDVINSYFSGSDEITVPAGGETLNVLAFGYDSDTGAGSYLLNSAVVTATQLTPAG